MDEDSDRVRKLRWLCRRGMKELDILLERFVDREQAALAAGAWPGLEVLLDAEDDLLWDMLQNPALPQAGPHVGLLESIRSVSA
jgi:antitoxin CptB